MTLPPDRAMSAALAVARDLVETLALISTTRGRSNQASWAAAFPLSRSALTVASPSRSSSLCLTSLRDEADRSALTVVLTSFRRSLRSLRTSAIEDLSRTGMTSMRALTCFSIRSRDFLSCSLNFLESG